MKFTTNELTIMAGAVFLQMRSPHIPVGCPHYDELEKLYDKLVKEIDHAKDHRR
jgi:hypothetical protein